MAGGRRENAGRNPGSGKYGETSTLIRIPDSLVDSITEQLRALEGFRKTNAQQIGAAPGAPKARAFTLSLPAGTPITGEESAHEICDLNALVVHDAETTAIYTVSGDSMECAHIVDGDRVVIDRAVEPRNGDIVVAVLAGEGPTLKRLKKHKGTWVLTPESNNPAHKPRDLLESKGDFIWGVLVGMVRVVRKRTRRTTAP